MSGWRRTATIVGATAMGSVGSALIVRDQFESPWPPLALVVGIAAVCSLLLTFGAGDWRATIVWLAIPLAGFPLVRSHLPIGIVEAWVTYAGATASQAALAEFRPLARWPRRAAAVAGLAIPLVMLAELGWGRRDWSRPVMGALLTTAFVITFAYQLAPGKAAEVDRVLGRAVRRVADAVGFVALFLVAVPFVYLPGAVVQLAELPGRRRRAALGTTWRDYAVSIEDERRDARWMFASTPRHARRRGNAFGAVAVAALVVAVIAIGAELDDRRDAAAAARPATQAAGADDADASPNFIIALEHSTTYSSMPAMTGSPWADDLQQMENSADPNGDIHSRWVNQRNGVRRSLAAPDCNCKHLRIWWLGGSAAWGTGQRDEYTIASQLVRLARQDGISLDILNLGARGSIVAHSFAAMAANLEHRRPPDLAIEYTGYNDAFANVVSEFVHGRAAGERIEALSFDDLTHVNGHVQEFLDWDGAEAAGRRAAARVREDVKRIDALAHSSGFDVEYFFQADALSNPAQLQGYDTLTGRSIDELMSSPLARGLRTTAKELEGSFTDLRPMFDGFDEPVFVGFVHQNETGARMVAERIYADLRPKLVKLAR